MKAPGWKVARLTLALLIESELPSWLFMSISGFEDNIVLLDLGVKVQGVNSERVTEEIQRKRRNR